MEPTATERESQKVCRLLVYTRFCRGKLPPKWAVKAAKDCYGNPDKLHEATRLLCGDLRVLSPKERDLVVYDGKSPLARKLADWWEAHQKHDKKRAKSESLKKKLTHAAEKELLKLKAAGWTKSDFAKALRDLLAE